MTHAIFSNPFKMDGSWFKGNLHTHSVNSDGLLEPFQLAFLYQAHGYDFLSITDHNKLTDVRDLSGKFEDFLFLPGEEIHLGRSEADTYYHLVALNLSAEIQPNGSPQSVIDETLDQGGEVLIAHPYWSSLTVNDLLGLKGYLGIEVYNTTCHVSIGKGYSTIHWDDLLVRGKSAFGFAVDDAHWHFNPHRPVDACRAWVMVKAKRLTTESLMDSLRKGLFYSSNGPKILGVEVNDESVYVKTSLAKAVNFIANSELGKRFTAINEPIEEVKYRLRGMERYVRIEVEDGKGGTAWTNPIVFQE